MKNALHHNAHLFQRSPYSPSYEQCSGHSNSVHGQTPRVSDPKREVLWNDVGREWSHAKTLVPYETPNHRQENQHPACGGHGKTYGNQPGRPYPLSPVATVAYIRSQMTYDNHLGHQQSRGRDDGAGGNVCTYRSPADMCLTTLRHVPGGLLRPGISVGFDPSLCKVSDRRSDSIDLEYQKRRGKPLSHPSQLGHQGLQRQHTSVHQGQHTDGPLKPLSVQNTKQLLDVHQIPVSSAGIRNDAVTGVFKATCRPLKSFSVEGKVYSGASADQTINMTKFDAEQRHEVHTNNIHGPTSAHTYISNESTGVKTGQGRGNIIHSEPFGDCIIPRPTYHGEMAGFVSNRHERDSNTATFSHQTYFGRGHFLQENPDSLTALHPLYLSAGQARAGQDNNSGVMNDRERSQTVIFSDAPYYNSEPKRRKTCTPDEISREVRSRSGPTVWSDVKLKSGAKGTVPRTDMDQKSVLTRQPPKGPASKQGISLLRPVKESGFRQKLQTLRSAVKTPREKGGDAGDHIQAKRWSLDSLPSRGDAGFIEPIQWCPRENVMTSTPLKPLDRDGSKAAHVDAIKHDCQTASLLDSISDLASYPQADRLAETRKSPVATPTLLSNLDMYNKSKAYSECRKREQLIEVENEHFPGIRSLPGDLGGRRHRNRHRTNLKPINLFPQPNSRNGGETNQLEGPSVSSMEKTQPLIRSKQGVVTADQPNVAGRDLMNMLPGIQPDIDNKMTSVPSNYPSLTRYSFPQYYHPTAVLPIRFLQASGSSVRVRQAKSADIAAIYSRLTQRPQHAQRFSWNTKQHMQQQPKDSELTIRAPRCPQKSPPLNNEQNNTNEGSLNSETAETFSTRENTSPTHKPPRLVESSKRESFGSQSVGEGVTNMQHWDEPLDEDFRPADVFLDDLRRQFTENGTPLTVTADVVTGEDDKNNPTSQTEVLSPSQDRRRSLSFSVGRKAEVERFLHSCENQRELGHFYLESSGVFHAREIKLQQGTDAASFWQLRGSLSKDNRQLSERTISSLPALQHQQISHNATSKNILPLRRHSMHPIFNVSGQRGPSVSPTGSVDVETRRTPVNDTQIGTAPMPRRHTFFHTVTPLGVSRHNSNETLSSGYRSLEKTGSLNREKKFTASSVNGNTKRVSFSNYEMRHNEIDGKCARIVTGCKLEQIQSGPVVEIRRPSSYMTSLGDVEVKTKMLPECDGQLRDNSTGLNDLNKPYKELHFQDRVGQSRSTRKSPSNGKGVNKANPKRPAVFQQNSVVDVRSPPSSSDSAFTLIQTLPRDPPKMHQNTPLPRNYPLPRNPPLPPLCPTLPQVTGELRPATVEATPLPRSRSLSTIAEVTLLPAERSSDVDPDTPWWGQRQFNNEVTPMTHQNPSPNDDSTSLKYVSDTVKYISLSQITALNININPKLH